MNVEHDITLAEYQALAEFRYQLRCFLRFSEQAARAVGLEPQQHQLLLALQGLPEGRVATVGELAERLQILHHSMVELINRMVDRNLLERSRGESDQRKVIIKLTLKADEVLRRLSLLHRTELRSSGPALVSVLHALIDNENDSQTRSE